MSARAFGRPGLTPVEIVGVLSLLAFSVGLLVPSVGHHRNLRQLTHENGNLRVIAQLMAKYSIADPNGLLGPVHPQGSGFLFEGYAEYGGGPGTMNFLGWDQDFDPRTRPFNHLLYGQSAIRRATAPGDVNYFKEFQCAGEDRGWQSWPGFVTDQRETERSYFEGNGTSFRMSNLQLSPATGGSSYVSVGIYGRSANKVPVPAQTLAFMEARAFQTLFTNDAWGFLEPGELKGYHNRAGYFTVIYADGRSDFVDFGDGTYYEQSPAHNNLDVRGTWGRVDCLPDAPIVDVLSATPAGMNTIMAGEGVATSLNIVRVAP